MDMALIFLAFFGGIACIFNGWPKFFTINIHKHYHNKDDKND